MLLTEIRKITIKEYHKMAEVGIIQPDEKVELINGEIFKLLSKVSIRHASHRRRLSNILTKIYLEKIATIGIQDTFHFDNYSEPIADLIIFKYSENCYSEEYPKPADVLVLIQFSDSTLIKRDKTEKLELYASANIPEYWVINLIDNCIEVFQNPKGRFYQKHLILTDNDVLNLPFEKTLKVSDILK